MATPPILLFSTDQQYYIDELKRLYNGRVLITPDGYTVKFFLNSDHDCLHALNGKDKTNFNRLRCRHISYIEYVLMEFSIRVVRKNRSSTNICFVSHSLKYAVICKVVRGKELKFVTQIMGSENYINGFDDRSKYVYL